MNRRIVMKELVHEDGHSIYVWKVQRRNLLRFWETDFQRFRIGEFGWRRSYGQNASLKRAQEDALDYIDRCNNAEAFEKANRVTKRRVMWKEIR